MSERVVVVVDLTADSFREFERTLVAIRRALADAGIAAVVSAQVREGAERVLRALEPAA